MEQTTQTAQTAERKTTFKKVSLTPKVWKDGAFGRTLQDSGKLEMVVEETKRRAKKNYIIALILTLCGGISVFLPFAYKAYWQSQGIMALTGEETFKTTQRFFLYVDSFLFFFLGGTLLTKLHIHIKSANPTVYVPVN